MNRTSQSEHAGKLCPHPGAPLHYVAIPTILTIVYHPFLQCQYHFVVRGTFHFDEHSVRVAFSGTTSCSTECDLERNTSGSVFFALTNYLYFTGQYEVKSARIPRVRNFKDFKEKIHFISSWKEWRLYASVLLLTGLNVCDLERNTSGSVFFALMFYLHFTGCGFSSFCYHLSGNGNKLWGLVRDLSSTIPKE